MDLKRGDLVAAMQHEDDEEEEETLTKSLGFIGFPITIGNDSRATAEITLLISVVDRLMEPDTRSFACSRRPCGVVEAEDGGSWEAIVIILHLANPL
ncbi:serine/threonine-protein phosphatase 2A regulatory subunit B'' subunit alpha [Corchorus capsularis]|uniref:Serine/threonine-protein phosphatase 2A regulatory subunit B'' subunit alpha n=1 Tax=Corchorus capsularis TaxID=210143 RepID=A0A1R3JIA6_COCAP|nr:serine/threonine-protein phosphatase 2A regulatory subunit B'' subunit alpha [Corchorus capsularis]